MTTSLPDLQAYCEELRSKYGERDAILDDMQRMYTLDWAGKDEMKKKFMSMKIVISPEPRNALKAALRLMTAADPIISIPTDRNDAPSGSTDRLERMANIMLRASDRIRGNPCSQDVVLSALLYDEIHVLVSSTKDLAALAQGKANKARAERISRLTPYLFSVQDPHGCYAEHDELGLRAWARRAQMTREAVVGLYGAAGEAAVGSMKAAKTKQEMVYVWTYYDLEDYGCWVEGGSTPIELKAHGLPVIPVAAHRVEGSRLFSDISDQSEPFLLTLSRSGLWEQQNTLLSAMYTSASLGLWPMMHYEGPDGTEPEVNTTTPLGFIHTLPGTKLEPWQKSLVDPQFVALWQQAQSLSEQSTIFKTVAGQPLGSGATFSETSLLNQAGRLPLIGTQRKAGWALGDALRIAFMLMRDSGGSYAAQYKDDSAKVSRADIPETLEVECSVEMSLPQDKLQASNIVNTLRGILPQRWLIENILNERQPDALMEEALTEQAALAMFQSRLQAKLQAEQMQQQQMAQMAQAAQQQQMQAPPQQAAPMPQPGGGNPMMGGLPPEMMMGGDQGPMGATGTPQEGQYGL